MNSKKVFAFCAVMMMGSVVFPADSHVDRKKQWVTVGFHLAEVAIGTLLIRHGIHLEEHPVRRYGSFGIGIACIARGLYDLHHDLHSHIFAHLNAWWNYKTQKKEADPKVTEA